MAWEAEHGSSFLVISSSLSPMRRFWKKRLRGKRVEHLLGTCTSLVKMRHLWEEVESVELVPLSCLNLEMALERRKRTTCWVKIYRVRLVVGEKLLLCGVTHITRSNIFCLLLDLGAAFLT